MHTAETGRIALEVIAANAHVYALCLIDTVGPAGICIFLPKFPVLNSPNSASYARIMPNYGPMTRCCPTSIPCRCAPRSRSSCGAGAAR